MILSNSRIDQLHTHYPSLAIKLENCTYKLNPGETVYGITYTGVTNHKNGSTSSGQYFCVPYSLNSKIVSKGITFIFIRYGFIGQHIIGTVEETGRLTYIDGCSDTLLVYPPRKGDASLNALYFPKETEQSFHTHPSIRFGVILNGSVIASLKEREVFLSSGDMFCIETNEIHRFKTTNEPATVIAYHPDGDWGPTDHDHSMINRTYIK